MSDQVRQLGKRRTTTVTVSARRLRNLVPNQSCTVKRRIFTGGGRRALATSCFGRVFLNTFVCWKWALLSSWSCACTYPCANYGKRQNPALAAAADSDLLKTGRFGNEVLAENKEVKALKNVYRKL